MENKQDEAVVREGSTEGHPWFEKVRELSGKVRKPTLPAEEADAIKGAAKALHNSGSLPFTQDIAWTLACVARGLRTETPATSQKANELADLLAHLSVGLLGVSVMVFDLQMLAQSYQMQASGAEGLPVKEAP